MVLRNLSSMLSRCFAVYSRVALGALRSGDNTHFFVSSIIRISSFRVSVRTTSVTTCRRLLPKHHPEGSPCPKLSGSARPAFSVGHFDPLISLRVESSGHFDHLIFTEWGVTCYRKTEVFKMITPVASLQLKSSSQSGNLIQQGLRIKLRKAELDFR